jgi:outer membrane protein OmpA-like peptidoglycan-associated protein
MAEDWLTDVRKYVADADEKVVGAIVRYCGIALRNVDSSLVSFSDKKETDRVRQNYLKKKLGLTQDDATLDAAIASVGERMKADRTKNRVTVYYLLAEHFGALGLFGAAKASAVAAAPVVAAATAAAAGGAVGLAAMAPAAAMASDNGKKASPAAAPSNRMDDDDGILGTGCAAAAAVIGAIILAALLAWWISSRSPSHAPAPAPAPVAAAPVAAMPAPEPPAPEGAGVVAVERDAKPILKVYFDTGKAAVTPDFTAAAGPVLAYLKANPDATLAISGFNDPTGNAAANAKLSKNRAENVKAAIEALGVAPERAVLEKPADATGTGATNAESRRVEVVIKG